MRNHDTSTDNSSDAKILQRTRAALDHDANTLDATSVAKLNQIRQRALHAAATPKTTWQPWVFSSAAVTCVLVITVFSASTWLSHDAAIAAPGAVIAELHEELQKNDVDLMMLEELELMEWLLIDEQLETQDS